MFTVNAPAEAGNGLVQGLSSEEASFKAAGLRQSLSFLVTQPFNHKGPSLTLKAESQRKPDFTGCNVSAFGNLDPSPKSNLD